MELDLTEAIEAGWQAIGGSRVRPITLPDPASYAEARNWDEFEENEIAMVEAVVRAAAPIIERAVRREGICGDAAPALIRTEEGDESGAGVMCELTHGHRSEWHEAPNYPGDPMPMRWRNTTVTISGVFDDR